MGVDPRRDLSHSPDAAVAIKRRTTERPDHVFYRRQYLNCGHAFIVTLACEPGDIQMGLRNHQHVLPQTQPVGTGESSVRKENTVDLQRRVARNRAAGSLADYPAPCATRPVLVRMGRANVGVVADLPLRRK